VTSPTWLAVPTPDGRTLEVLLQGPEDGFPLVFHSGTPSAAAPFAVLSEAAGAYGLRTVSWSRPGYGDSTELPGRSVADVTDDVRTVLTGLGHEEFVTLGWSGGGPHALACAARMPQACRAAATLAGVAPVAAGGLDWFDGMGEENHTEFRAALAGREALSEYLTKAGAEIRFVTADEVAEALGDLASEVDIAAITGELADFLADSFRRAVRNGISGWRDDDLAFARGWGFELAAIDVPVAIWQGRHDRMVPYAHGVWLADHIDGAHAHLDDSEGHLSLLMQASRIFADLIRIAGLPSRSPA
jgi:pimeloyl-ACP methyl ester carboxylesterase